MKSLSTILRPLTSFLNIKTKTWNVPCVDHSKKTLCTRAKRIDDSDDENEHERARSLLARWSSQSAEIKRGAWFSSNRVSRRVSSLSDSVRFLVGLLPRPTSSVGRFREDDVFVGTNNERASKAGLIKEKSQLGSAIQYFSICYLFLHCSPLEDVTFPPRAKKEKRKNRKKKLIGRASEMLEILPDD